MKYKFSFPFFFQIILENLAKCYGFFKQHDKAAQVLDQALVLDKENLDLLTLRVRMLALGNQLHEAKTLVETALPIAEEREATETIGQVGCVCVCVCVCVSV